MNLNSAIAIAIAATICAAPPAALADARWRGDMRHFHNGDAHRWAGGHWYHGRHDGRLGWWWVIGAATVGTALWYAYSEPVYPYPDPYVPPTILVAPPAPAAPQVLQPSPPAVWYYCPSSRQYYPYVGACPDGWKTVPATPAGE